MATNLSCLIRKATREDDERLNLILVHENDNELEELLITDNNFFAIENKVNVLYENVAQYMKIPTHLEYDGVICTSRNVNFYRKCLEISLVFNLPLYAEHFPSNVEKGKNWKETLENLKNHIYIGLPKT